MLHEVQCVKHFTQQKQRRGPAWSSGGTASVAQGKGTGLPKARTVSKAELWAAVWGSDHGGSSQLASGVCSCSVYIERTGLIGGM